MGLLIAAYDPVMLDECAAYRTFKDGKILATDPSDDDAEEWERSIRIAKSENLRLTSLKTVGICWGRDVIQHYQWTSRQLKFCGVLRTAALAVPDLSEAIVKLNLLMLRRHQFPGQRLIRDSASPVSQADLSKLAAWGRTNSPAESHRESAAPRLLAAQDLPDGFGFDKFGLLVRAAYAAVPGADSSDVWELSDTTDSNTETFAETVADTTGSPTNSTAISSPDDTPALASSLPRDAGAEPDDTEDIEEIESTEDTGDQAGAGDCTSGAYANIDRRLLCARKSHPTARRRVVKPTPNLHLVNRNH